MTLKNLLNTMNFNNQVRIYIHNENKDELILIFKGTSENAIKYFDGVDKTLYAIVEFINVSKDYETNAPALSIVME